MYFINKTHKEDGYYIKIITGDFIGNKKIYTLLIKQRIFEIYDLDETGLLFKIHTWNLFCNVRSVDVVEKEKSYIAVCTDGGVLVILNIDREYKIHIVDKFIIGRSGCRLTGPGYYLNFNQDSCMLSSLYGNLLLLSCDKKLECPKTLNKNSIILDNKKIGQNFCTIEKHEEESLSFNIYEYSNGMILNRFSMKIHSSSYLIIPISEKQLLLVSEINILLFEDNNIIDVIDIPSIESQDRVRFIIAYAIHRIESKKMDFILICDEDGNLFKVSINQSTSSKMPEDHKINKESKGILILTYYDSIEPCKDIVIHRNGFILALGDKQNNSVYHIKSLGNENYWESQKFFKRNNENRNIKKVYQIETFYPISNAVITTESNNLNIFYTHKNSIRKFILEKQESLIFSSKNESKNIKIISLMNKNYIVKMDSLDEIFIEEERIKTTQILKTKIIDIIENKDKFIYLQEDSLEFYSNSVLIRKTKIDYINYCFDEHYLILVDKNKLKIYNLESEEWKHIDLEILVIEIQIFNNLIFIVTGKYLLRVYDLLNERWVYIQVFEDKIEKILIHNCQLFVAASNNLYIFKINEFKRNLWLPMIKSIDEKVVKLRKSCEFTICIFQTYLYLINKANEFTKINIQCQDLIYNDSYLIAIYKKEIMLYSFNNEVQYSSKMLKEEKNVNFILRKNKHLIIKNFINTFELIEHEKSDGIFNITGNGNAIDYLIYDPYVIVAVEENFKNLLKVYNGNSLVYERETDNKIRRITNVDESIIVASKNILTFYEFGKMNLLKKFVQEMPSDIIEIKIVGNRVFVGTMKHSVLLFIYKDKKLIKLAEDFCDRWIVNIEIIDYNNIILSDKFGNICVLNCKIEEKLERSLTENLVSKKNIYLKNQNEFYVGDIVVEFYVSNKRIFYVTLGGKIGELILISEEEFEIFEILEEEIEKKSTLKLGDYNKHMNTFYIRRNVVDFNFLNRLTLFTDEELFELSGKLNIKSGDVSTLMQKFN